MSTPKKLTDVLIDIARGPHLMPASANHQIAHYQIDESGIVNPPTVGDLQMQLTTALSTVDELTAHVCQLTNALSNAERDRDAARVALDDMAAKYSAAIEAGADAVAERERTINKLRHDQSVTLAALEQGERQ